MAENLGMLNDDYLMNKKKKELGPKFQYEIDKSVKELLKKSY